MTRSAINDRSHRSKQHLYSITSRSTRLAVGDGAADDGTSGKLQGAAIGADYPPMCGIVHDQCLAAAARAWSSTRLRSSKCRRST
jgi:hypothetical protein